MPEPALPAVADPERLTDVLRRSGVLRGERVEHATVERSFPTILSYFFRLRLGYDAKVAGAPDSLILKAGLAERQHGPWMGGRHEVAFYQQVAPDTPSLVPRCFDARWEVATGVWHVLLEDLTDSHLIATPWPLPPTTAQCEQMVRARARFQAAWWDDPRLGVTVGEWLDVDAYLPRLAEQVGRFVEAAGDRLSRERHDLYARLIAAAPRLVARYQTHRQLTIVHGDAHVWNCFLPRADGLDDVRLFDWDAWRIGIATDDLALMIAIHWYPDLRRRIESHLLDCYHEELVACGVRGYDRRALQDDYRLSVLWEAFKPAWQSAAGIPPVIWWNNLERIHLAIDDLGCRELLG